MRSNSVRHEYGRVITVSVSVTYRDYVLHLGPAESSDTSTNRPEKKTSTVTDGLQFVTSAEGEKIARHEKGETGRGKAGKLLKVRLLETV